MHSCPKCEQACYCDGDDLPMQVDPEGCCHECSEDNLTDEEVDQLGDEDDDSYLDDEIPY